jgi:hypothetical protein
VSEGRDGRKILRRGKLKSNQHTTAGTPRFTHPMKKHLWLRSALAAMALSLSPFTHAQFTGFGSSGLVGVGRVSGDVFDALGPNVDSLGGIGSSLFVDQSSVLRSGDAVNGFTYSGTLYGVPDRGFNGATLDYHPRVHTFSFAITPYYGSVPTNQTQIALNNTASTLFTYDGTNFTGFEANDTNATSWPQAPLASLGQGHRSLDPEGLARAADGTFYVGDEYGPSILHFDASGALLARLIVPEAFIPKRGNFPGANVFGTNAIVNGRIRNRGFEGLSITPDGRRLVAALQSPLQQDGSASVLGRNTRLLLFDVETGSPTHGRMVAEYVYQLTLNGNATTNRQTLASEILALNSETFLVLERDSLGLGDATIAVPNYKAIVAVSTRGATNIANTGYDLERGAPGALILPTNAVLSGIAPVARFDLVQIITSNDLARFNLNLNTNKDANTLSEKWEGLGLIPLGDPAAPDDFLLLAANDNDFVATNIYQNGVFVGTNALTIDNMILAYRVSLPGVGAAAPANSLPGVTLAGPTNATLSAPAAFTLTANGYDQDGIITNVEFFEGAVKIGEDTTFPFQLALAGVAAGNHSYTALVSDNSGATATSAPRVVVVTVNNLLPNVTLAGPTNATLSAPALVALTSAASDPDGTVTKVEFYDDATKIGQKLSVPYTLTVSNVPAGLHTYTAVATDNQGATSNSVAFLLTVTETNISPNVTLLTPTNNFTATQAVNIAFSASASDPDGFITKVEYYRGGTKLGQAIASPYSFTASNFVAGTNLVRAVAYDNQGATTASADATVIVRDLTAPVMVCSSNILVSCTNPAGTTATFIVTATDNNDPSVTVVCTPTSGSLFPAGTNTVNCTAADAAGNSSACSFKVIILPSLVTIERAIILRWNCGEMLQCADVVTGPWSDIPGAVSPYCVPSEQAKRFYRVRN